MTATYNARPGQQAGTKASARFVRMSATKARAVLDLIRGADVRTAEETLRFCERDAALVIGKLLRSAVANAEHNDDQIGDDLMVSACYADEGRTIRRFRPRARGRATRIRKRTCHITLVVSRMPEEQLERRRSRQATRPGNRGSRRAGQEAAEERTTRTRRRRSRKTGAAAPPQAPDANRQQTPGSEEPTPPPAAETGGNEAPAPPAPSQTDLDDDGEGLSFFEDDTSEGDTSEGDADRAGTASSRSGAQFEDDPPQEAPDASEGGDRGSQG